MRSSICCSISVRPLDTSAAPRARKRSISALSCSFSSPRRAIWPQADRSGRIGGRSRPQGLRLSPRQSEPLQWPHRAPALGLALGHARGVLRYSRQGRSLELSLSIKGAPPPLRRTPYCGSAGFATVKWDTSLAHRVRPGASGSASVCYSLSFVQAHLRSSLPIAVRRRRAPPETSELRSSDYSQRGGAHKSASVTVNPS